MQEAIPHRRHWYLDRGVNPVYITTLAGFIISILAWAMNQDRIQVKQDEKIAEHEAKIITIEKNSREDAQRTQDKLDKILERVERHK